jgi:hypothetical protein
VVLRTLLQGARLRPASRRPEVPRTRHVTIVPSRGSRVVLEERLGPPTATTRPSLATTS